MTENIMSNRRITRPHILWLGSRCFRVIGDVGSRSSRNKTVTRSMIENLDWVEVPEDTEPIHQTKYPYTIRKLVSGVLEASLPVPRYMTYTHTYYYYA